MSVPSAPTLPSKVAAAPLPPVAPMPLANLRISTISPGVSRVNVARLDNAELVDASERACTEIDRAPVAFLPTLAPDQAAFVSVDFPFPLQVSIGKPTHAPDYQASWNIKC